MAILNCKKNNDNDIKQVGNVTVLKCVYEVLSF